MSDDDGFLSRWSRRKADVKAGRETPPEPTAERGPPLPVRAELVEAPSPTVALSTREPAALGQKLAQEPAQVPAQVPTEPLPTLDDVQTLRPGDPIARFVARGVDEAVKRAALKKLFADPHFNVMDGLDIYIDDYSQPDPIPAAMLREMNQSKFMRLFADEEAPAAAPVVEPLAHDASERAAAVPRAPDEDADLQLQPHDPARRSGA